MLKGKGEVLGFGGKGEGGKGFDIHPQNRVDENEDRLLAIKGW